MKPEKSNDKERPGIDNKIFTITLSKDWLPRTTLIEEIRMYEYFYNTLRNKLEDLIKQELDKQHEIK